MSNENVTDLTPQELELWITKHSHQVRNNNAGREYVSVAHLRALFAGRRLVRAGDSDECLVDENARLKSEIEGMKDAIESVIALCRARDDAWAENDAITELNHKQFLLLENIRLYAARHRREPWGEEIIRLLSDGGISGSPLRAAPTEALPPKTYEDGLLRAAEICGEQEIPLAHDLYNEGVSACAEAIEQEAKR